MNSSFSNIFLDFFDDISLETASIKDEKYVQDRANRFRNSQGFLPRSAIKKFIEEKRVFICKISCQSMGYVLTTGGRRSPLVVRHNTVDPEIWNCGFGRRWIEALLSIAAATTPFDFIKVRTREDLVFQSRINAAVGGSPISTSIAPGARGFRIITWHLPCIIDPNIEKNVLSGKFGAEKKIRLSVQ